MSTTAVNGTEPIEVPTGATTFSKADETSAPDSTATETIATEEADAKPAETVPETKTEAKSDDVTPNGDTITESSKHLEDSDSKPVAKEEARVEPVKKDEEPKTTLNEKTEESPASEETHAALKQETKTNEATTKSEIVPDTTTKAEEKATTEVPETKEKSSPAAKIEENPEAISGQSTPAPAEEPAAAKMETPKEESKPKEVVVKPTAKLEEPKTESATENVSKKEEPTEPAQKPASLKDPEELVSAKATSTLSSTAANDLPEKKELKIEPKSEAAPAKSEPVETPAANILEEEEQSKDVKVITKTVAKGEVDQLVKPEPVSIDAPAPTQSLKGKEPATEPATTPLPSVAAVKKEIGDSKEPVTGIVIKSESVTPATSAAVETKTTKEATLVVSDNVKTTTTTDPKTKEQVDVKTVSAILTETKKTTVVDPGKEDDGNETFFEKVENVVEIVADNVVETATDTLTTIKAHPELIAEGALAIAVGAASLIAPELIAGEVAIIGKMASDAAKKTTISIAQTEGSKLAKAIGEDLTAEDVKEAAEKAAAEAKAKAAETPAAPVDASKEVAKAATDPIVAPVDAKTSPAAGDKTISIQVAKDDTPKAAGSKDDGDTKPEEPVSLKITIGADGNVKSVSQDAPKTEVAAPKTEVAAPAEEKTKEIPNPNTNAPVEKAVEEPKPTPAAIKTNPEEKKASEATPTLVVTEPSPVEDKSKDITPAVKEPIKVEEPVATPTEPVIPVENGVKPSESTEVTPVVEANEPVSEPAKEVEKSPSSEILQAVAPITGGVVAGGVLSNVVESSKKSDEEPATLTDKPMATISQESLDHLHRKIDAVHAALQNIQIALATRLPAPTEDTPTAIETKPTEPIEEQAPAATEPIAPTEVAETATPADAVPEQTAETPAAPEPAKKTHQKRGSVWGSVGKILWPFGGSAPAPAAATESTPAAAEGDGAPTSSTPTATESLRAVKKTDDAEVAATAQMGAA